MHKQNEGKSADDILQNQFIAYLVTAVKRRKALYIRKKVQQQAFCLTLLNCIQKFRV